MGNAVKFSLDPEFKYYEFTLHIDIVLFYFYKVI